MDPAVMWMQILGILCWSSCVASINFAVACFVSPVLLSLLSISVGLVYTVNDWQGPFLHYCSLGCLDCQPA